MLRVNGFYGHVKSNDFRSLVMFSGFILAIQLAIATVMVLPLLFFDAKHVPLWNLTGYFTRYGIYIMLISIVLFGMQFILYEQATRASSRFYYVNRRTHPRIVNLVEQQAIAAGLPLPKVALIDTPARNAFACGIMASSAVVVVTRGLAEALDDDELKAVIAHEIAHIANGDIRLMAAANIMMRNLLTVQRVNPLLVNSNKKVLMMVVLPPFLMLVLFAGFINHFATMCARASRLLISSSREFIADAEAVRLTHNPAALISALRKIEGRSLVDGIDPDVDSMMIDGASEGAMATHPTISERVAILTRLSGSMAFDLGMRKDTRPTAYEAVDRGRGFGRKGLPAGATASVATPASAPSPWTPPEPQYSPRPWEDVAPPQRTLPKRTSTSAGGGIFDRIKEDSDRNIFGMLPEHVRTLRFGCLGLILLQVGCVGLVSYATRSITPSKVEEVASRIDRDKWRETGKGRYERRRDAERYEKRRENGEIASAFE
jgi:Zn-dependent protease with chaperone function